MSFVIDPTLEQEAKDTTPLETSAMEKNLRFFQQCAENRELLQSIEIVIPVRPQGGMNCHLARMCSIWYGEGTAWSHLNDHMGGYIEVTRANIAYDFVHRPRPKQTKYLLMIDNDMEPCMNLPFLLARHDKPIVAGVAMHLHEKEGPRACFTVMSADGKYRWPRIRRHKFPRRGLIPCGHAGTGAMMIRRDVLESFKWDSSAEVPFYVPEEIRVAGAKIGRLTLGEDLAFCEQARAKGFTVHVDAEAHVGHRKTVVLHWEPSKIDDSIDAETWRLPAEGIDVGK